VGRQWNRRVELPDKEVLVALYLGKECRCRRKVGLDLDLDLKMEEL
jgi:hypothetical protein